MAGAKAKSKQLIVAVEVTLLTQKLSKLQQLTLPLAQEQQNQL
jgi:hypothetical protein